MNTLEDTLRAALRETGDEISPAGLPALRLPETGTRAPERTRRSRPVAALAAAAAVTAIVATSVTLATGHHPRPGRPAPPAQPAKVTLPPYYLALTSTGYPYYDNPLHAAIRATATGATLAAIKPPAPFGTFIGGTTAAGDRIFVLAIQRWHPANTSYADGINSGQVRFVLARFNPATHATSMRTMRAPVIAAGAGLQGMALSPDGSRLAVAVQLGASTEQIRVYTLATGAVRTWTADAPHASIGMAPAQNEIDPRALSWTADGRTLGYAWWGPRTGLGLLDTAAAGHSLLASSRIVAPARPVTCLSDPQILPDGDAFGCAATWLSSRPVRTRGSHSRLQGPGRTAGVPIGFGEFSASSGALLRVLDKMSYRGSRPLSQQLLWVAASGNGLLVESPLPYWGRIALIRPGKISLLPAAVRISVPDVTW